MASYANEFPEHYNLEAAFKGSRIDQFFKEFVEENQFLYGQKIQITPRFKFGPDICDPVNNAWYDVTTQEQWLMHVAKYTAQFGRGMPLFYK